MPKEPIPFTILDGSLLTYGIRVLPDGVDMTQFKKNPVMLYRHNDWDLPVGKWDNGRFDNGLILGSAIFDYEDDDKDVKRMIGKVERGFLNMASAGLVDLEVSDDDIYKLPGQTGPTVIKCRLREASIVSIGGNNNAFRLFDREGKQIDLSDEKGLNLSDFIVNPKIDNSMYKNYLSKLNLADTATEAEFYAKVDLLLADKVKVDGELAAEKLKVTASETAKTELQTKIDAIELADKTAQKTAFDKELADSFLDGRLSEKPEGDKATPVKDRMLSLFDKDPEGTMALVKDLPKHKQGINLSDVPSPDGETAWDKRQKEIAANTKGKK